MGIVSIRRRRQRMQRVRRRLLIAGLIVMLIALGMSQDLHGIIEKAAQRVTASQVFADLQSEQAELTLPVREIYALQLGVFDDVERALQEAARLQGLGVRCVVWQKEKMRIISSVAFTRDALDMESAKGQDAYVIRQALPEVALRLEAGAGELEDARQLLTTPDSVLISLLDGDNAQLETIVADTRAKALAALGAHPENQLYTELAQSLIDWCDLMDTEIAQEGKTRAHGYAAVTICTLCRELRAALTAS